MKERRERDEKRDVKRNAPRPLPPKRPRSLTWPLPEPNKSPSRSWNPLKRFFPMQKTLNQLQSPLFARLPVEIRQLIWSKILGGNFLHIGRVPKRLLAINCLESPELQQLGLDTRYHICWGFPSCVLSTTPDFYFNSQVITMAKPANPLPLLQTCRIVYTEAISILYRENIFDFIHLNTFQYFQRSVLPERLNQIRVLNFSWAWAFRWPTSSTSTVDELVGWRQACDTLASFAGLKELRVHMTGVEVSMSKPYVETDGGNKWGKNRWEQLLEPLMHSKAATIFDVFLPLSEDWCVELSKGSGYPFRLISNPLKPMKHSNPVSFSLSFT